MQATPIKHISLKSTLTCCSSTFSQGLPLLSSPTVFHRNIVIDTAHMCHVCYVVRPYHCHCFDHAPINSTVAVSDIFLSTFFFFIKGPPDCILSRYSNKSTGWTIRGSAAYRRKKFSLHQNVQTNWGPPNLIFSGYWVISLGVRRLELRLTTQYSAEIKNEWEYSLTPTVCLHRVGSDSYISDA
jgi:hypothetical protein